MFSTFNISYLFIAFTKTILAHSISSKSKSRGSCTTIPLWLVSTIILLGIIDLLIIVYIIWKYFARRMREEDEGNKNVPKKDEGVIERLQTSLPYSTTVNKMKIKDLPKQEERFYDTKNNETINNYAQSNNEEDNITDVLQKTDKSEENGVLIENINEIDTSKIPNEVTINKSFEENICVGEELEDIILPFYFEMEEDVKNISLLEVEDLSTSKETDAVIIPLKEELENDEVSSQHWEQEILYAPKKQEIIEGLKNLKNVNLEKSSMSQENLKLRKCSFPFKIIKTGKGKIQIQECFPE